MIYGREKKQEEKRREEKRDSIYAIKDKLSYAKLTNSRLIVDRQKSPTSNLSKQTLRTYTNKIDSRKKKGR